MHYFIVAMFYGTFTMNLGLVKALNISDLYRFPQIPQFKRKLRLQKLSTTPGQ